MIQYQVSGQNHTLVMYIKCRSLGISLPHSLKGQQPSDNEGLSKQIAQKLRLMRIDVTLDFVLCISEICG